MRLLSTGLLDWQGWFLLTLVVALLVRKATYIYCAAEWLRLAPEQTRVVVREARREAAEAVAEKQRLEEENSILRGQIAAIKQAAGKQHRLELVYPVTKGEKNHVA